ncbi:MAG: 2-(1,2-epoxy-1,2-dihydrophenyl)acetyl-CoA isomerase [Chloroflexi bacterium]|nr:MAG: 2-(1,2-epoxy-1,2-dihydrophenyl)acetyl-CoA isomerase [Chloroflexota bacterium]TME16302.1 MAG: 2-(1,2-epoxy-1,2-dihydrophenyl)acetyl-CoA isomerase [Chloroflexota bacterium]TME19042.1 MAG: 2-(1,2-epoxy-1,2-dihydrophenyl)acetyl-CoA isomerase [Chloroflexota bacterium]
MAEQPEERHVTLEREAGVAWIRFNRPEKLNPIGVLARQQLDAALKEVERDESVRCVVLIGSGRGFSAGADVREMGSAEGGMRSSEDVGRVLREQYAPMLQRIRSMPKPVICGLNGVAAGIGASFAMACDIRIAADDAYFSEAFVGIGLAPDGGATWMLPRFVGRGKALEMFFTGKPLAAADAERLGLVNRVVPKAEVESSCRELATALAAGATKAMAAGKRAVNFAETASFEEALEFEAWMQEAQASSEDFLEGVRAFLEKRKPEFSGR